MPDSPSVVVCFSTVSDQDQARAIASQLLEERLAACIQIDGPIESHYVWQGEVCCETEFLLMIKTSPTGGDRLLKRLRSIHPYEQPEILILAADQVDPGYARWVQEQTVSP